MSASEPLILDATVVSNYACSRSLTWLGEQSIEIEVPATVRREIERGLESGHDFLRPAISFSDGESVAVVAVEREADDLPYSERLDSGETAALTRTESAGGTLATDDGTARQIARGRSVSVTGSTGLLILGIERDTLPIETAEQWLQCWREERDYYAPVTTIRDALSES